jgi:hypothetical protein
MVSEEFEVGSAKAAIGSWIEELTVSGHALPEAVKRDLIEQLASATPQPDAQGRMHLEIPGLSSLGVGIFQRSFVVHGKVVRIAPYVQSVVATPTAGMPNE